MIVVSWNLNTGNHVCWNNLTKKGRKMKKIWTLVNAYIKYEILGQEKPQVKKGRKKKQ